MDPQHRSGRMRRLMTMRAAAVALAFLGAGACGAGAQGAPAGAEPIPPAALRAAIVTRAATFADSTRWTRSGLEDVLGSAGFEALRGLLIGDRRHITDAPYDACAEREMPATARLTDAARMNSDSVTLRVSVTGPHETRDEIYRLASRGAVWWVTEITISNWMAFEPDCGGDPGGPALQTPH